jgi:hypothetical protein
MMPERCADAARKLYAGGGYNGRGSLPWNYRPVRREGSIELEPGPGLVPTITEGAEAVSAGGPVCWIQRSGP